LKITQYSEAPNYKNEFKILNMISKPNDITLNNDNDVYRHYGLNSKEINLVKSVVASSSSTKEKAASKINNFVTKKLREKKARTKKASKGGRRQTRKHGRGKTTRRQYQ
jgi:hypothetical protein